MYSTVAAAAACCRPVSSRESFRAMAIIEGLELLEACCDKVGDADMMLDSKRFEGKLGRRGPAVCGAINVEEVS